MVIYYYVGIMDRMHEAEGSCFALGGLFSLMTGFQCIIPLITRLLYTFLFFYFSFCLIICKVSLST